MTDTAKITKPDGYDCAPLGHTVEHYPCGDIVTGQVAGWAIADNAASRMFNPVEETKIVSPPENKRKRRK